MSEVVIPAFERVRDGNRHTVPEHRRSAPRPKWTNDEIVRAIQKWAELYGNPPACADWNPSMARSRGTPARQARYANGIWPATATVMRHFGTWRVALQAAGFDAGRAGPHDPSLSASRADFLSRRNLERLRGRETTLVGPATLAKAVKAVAIAERGDEPELLQDALLDLAAVAVAWADRAER